jgi:2-polyprenyl-3-methyl-5-hydroxy-6-metoxy-1,4-benzoquinol methylase
LQYREKISGMANTSRVDKELFKENHYLGKPADDEDKIISRRIGIIEKYPEFFNRSMTCIEVGCGSGATITQVASRFEKCIGVDIYDYHEQFAAKKEKYSAHNAMFRQMDLENELPDEQYDRLISFEVIEHLKNEQSVASYSKVLKEGGMAAISVPNKWWIFETHGARLPLLPWNRVPFFSWLPRNVHERYSNARIYTKSRIIKLLERNGFTIIDTCYITAPMDVLKDGPLKRAAVKYIFKGDITKVPFLSTSIFIMAQKK